MRADDFSEDLTQLSDIDGVRPKMPYDINRDGWVLVGGDKSIKTTSTTTIDSGVGGTGTVYITGGGGGGGSGYLSASSLSGRTYTVTYTLRTSS